VRHGRGPVDGQVSGNFRRSNLLFLLAELPRQVHGKSGTICCSGPGAVQTRALRNHLDLPHAPGNPAVGAWLLPHLRHGAGTGNAYCRGCPKPRAARYDAPFLDRLGAGRTGLRPGDDRAFGRSARSPVRSGTELDPARSGHARSSLGVAWLYSMLATLVPHIFPSSMRGMDGAVPVYFEAAAVITALALLGQVLELRAREQTSGAMKALLGLAPKTARRIRPDGSDEEVEVDAVMVGDRLRVRPGEKVPVDGTVLEGRSAVDESMVTGESMPVTKAEGARLIGGTINRSGGLVMQATEIGRDTMLSRIVQLVAAAQRSRAPIQRLADQVSGWFVPLVIVIAVLAFVAWMVWGPEPRLAHALVAAVSVLIIACPCALGLATPMSIMVGVGKGAQLGLLIKNAEALERLEKVDTIVVDKTGTLTEGRPSLTWILPGACGQPRTGQRASPWRGHRGRSGGSQTQAVCAQRRGLSCRQGSDRHGRWQAGAHRQCQIS
jgi:hypothetical protein